MLVLINNTWNFETNYTTILILLVYRSLQISKNHGIPNVVNTQVANAQQY